MPVRAPSSNKLWRQAALLWFVFSLVLVEGHAAYWKLPYYWDEIGQFIPQSLDLLQEGRLIPVHTTPNVHPPGLFLLLASLWKIAGGHSVALTRIAMLGLAAFGATGAFVLSIRLSRRAPAAPGFVALALLLTSPLFYTQAMMAQLDMPAMVFSTWALVFFLERRLALTAAYATAAVLMKETAIVLPLVLAAWLWFGEPAGRRWRQVLQVAGPPLLLLAFWVGYLWVQTGNPLGEARFADYNALYSLHPVRLGAALLRRVFYLFFAEFRWIGTATLAWMLVRRKGGGWFSGQWEWRVVTAFAIAHMLVVSVFGGAVLERYLLPVLPVVFAAFAVAVMNTPGRWRMVLAAIMAVGGLVSLRWYPFYPFPLENNLAMVDFVEIHQLAASHISDDRRIQVVATAWPFSDALRRPEFGYVNRPLRVIETGDFGASTVAAALRGAAAPKPDAVLLYHREWEEDGAFARAFYGFRSHFYQFAPPVTGGEIESLTGFHMVFRWDHGRMWAELYR